MTTATELLAELQILRTELEDDIAICTTREQHIRATQRLTRLDAMLEQFAAQP